MQKKRITKVGYNILAAIAAIALLCPVLPVSAQDNDPPQEIAGDTYFDFAFRDEANIIQHKILGQTREEMLAQSNDETPQNDEEETDENADNPDDPTSNEKDRTSSGNGLTSTEDAYTGEASGKDTPGEQNRELTSTEDTYTGEASGKDTPGEQNRELTSTEDAYTGEASGKDTSGELNENSAIDKLKNTNIVTYRVADLTIDCDLKYCEDKENIEKLLRATGLQLGHETTNVDLAISIERLRKTRYFSNIFQELTFEGKDRVKVHFRTVPHTVIRKVIIEKSGSLYKSEVKKRMILRPGGILYPRTAILRGMTVDEIPKEKLITMALEDQIKSLERIYSKEGYFDAEVTIIPTEVEPNLVDLHVSVNNAESYVLGQIYVRGHSIKTYSEIEDTFRSGFGFFGGVTKAEIEDAVEKVLQEYRKEGYYQTKIEFVSRRVPKKKTVDVFLDIKESAQWEVQFEGNELLSNKELSESLTFESSGYVDQSEVEASAEALQQAYISAGYYWAQVTGEMLSSYANGTHVIIFKIKEGERAEIGQISFAGASAFSHDELMDLISSTEYSAFGSGAYPQRSMIADDAANIVDAYREIGYLNADVTGWTLEPLSPNGRLLLTFIIHEGERSHFAHRQIRYTDRETYDRFDVLIDKPENDIFSDSTFRTERAAITKQLRARGHATISDRVRCTSYASDGSIASTDTCEIAEFSSACLPDDLVAMCEFIETRNGIMERCKRHFDTEYGIEGEPKCELKNGVTGTEVDVEYEVTLGPKYSFGDTFIHGNVVTREWVVNQDIPFKADETFDYNRVIDARSLLRRRTIYSSASLNVIGVDDDLTTQSESGDSTSTTERPVPIVVTLEEGERRWFDFALGLQYTGGDWIATGEVEYVEANLLGTGWQLSLLLMPEARIFKGSQFVLNQKLNQNFFTLLSLTIPVIPASGFNIISQWFYDLRFIPKTNKEELGWLVELQWQLSKAWFTALAFELESSSTASAVDENTHYSACYPFTFFYGKCPFDNNSALFTVSITPRASYDGRDNPLTPKYGIFAETKIKFAYADNVGFYVKPEAHVSYVYTFLKYFTLALNMRFGVSFLKENSELPYIDRYFLGGLNMRGYEDEALGPRLINDIAPATATDEAGGGEVLFNFTTEIRYPIWNDIGLYGAIFVDMGALTPYQPTNYSPGAFAEELFVNQMRYTAGMGLRWLISEAIPPIVLDYGFIINRRRGDPIGGFSINVGYTF